ncbi:MAG: L-aspartate oxidase [Desulfurivibrionaceae bacterium]|nr:L-aspartate oxidase [Pseudomonadota bacterium]MCG2822518.1 L-aspartate oxidase [Desulfobulbaceae bacterium]MDP2757896.1 L-aspartate oxidase [Desulfurivibrionaceae bacterium]PKN22073.1 MAG: L-aspartate oxidase [Deltaproteobacteria bacterium HGW-Deltaproteobacteria-3]MBU4228965.1 L-aspartate oxidase [Pseudomonadota bacterium]
MKYSTDFLVIGSGISGLSYAIKAARLGSVTIVTKKAKVDTATNLAQGGIAAVLSPEDSFALHIADTLRSGAGLCHEDIVKLVVETGPARIEELIRLGVQFQSEAGDPTHLDLGKEGGHSARRIAHAMDLTGRKIEEGLLAQVAANPKITVLENHLAVDLLVSSKTGTPYQPHDNFSDQCLGAYVFDRETGRIDTYQAKVTVLCTGGTGKVYLYTTNPDIATGDGIAMAYRAGARVGNLEFVQFHPTCLYHPQVKNFLISEAVRGEGGRLIDQHGQAFMHKYDARGDLATRDTVARAIDSEMKGSGDDCVYLDITHQPAEFLKNRFPTIYTKCLSLGIDMTKVPIPVVPAAHYMCGGVITDRWGRTNIEGLFAFGETACTGMHGGNRLASNSLLEAVVFAHQAFLECEREWPELREAALPEVAEWSAGAAQRIEENVLVSHNWDQIRRLMWNYVGIVRTEKRLALVQERLRAIAGEVNQHYRDYILTPDLIELRNIAQVAELIVRCACIRKESRGLHYLVDFPQHDDAHWKKDTIIQRQGGAPGLATCSN